MNTNSHGHEPRPAGYGLGIDIGTATTFAAVLRDGTPSLVNLRDASPLMTSVVKVRPAGPLTVGTEDGSPVPALAFLPRLGDSTPVEVGERSVPPGDLLTALLQAVLRRVSDLEGGPPDRVVLTCPASWGPYRREQFAAIAQRAGLPRAKVILVGAAQAAAVNHLRIDARSAGRPIVVYDAGGGSFDATVLITSRSGSARVIGTPESLEWLGGVDLDEMMLRQIGTALDLPATVLDPAYPGSAAALKRLREEAVRVREELSAAPEAGVRKVTISRRQLEDAARPQFSDALATLRRSISSAGLGAGDLADVLLVGGVAHMPLLARMLADDLGRPVTLVREPQYQAALGAAVLSAADAGTGPIGLPIAGTGSVELGGTGRVSAKWLIGRGVLIIAVSAAAGGLAGRLAGAVGGWIRMP